MIENNIYIRKNETSTSLMINNMCEIIIYNNFSLDSIDDLTESMFVEEIMDLSYDNVLNIGLGGGFTTYKILQNKNIKQVDVVEIYSRVIELLENFPTKIILEDSRLNIINSDIRDYLGEDMFYDCVVMDVCHPDKEPSMGLFESDFFMKLSNITNHLLIWYYSPKSCYGKNIETIKNKLIKYFPNTENKLLVSTYGEYSYFSCKKK